MRNELQYSRVSTSSQQLYKGNEIFLNEMEQSVQMRLYTMHKREFVSVFVVFFILFGLAVCIGLAGPKIILTEELQATTLKPPINKSSIATGPFVLPTSIMSTYSQQLWVTCKIIKEHKDHESFRAKFQMMVTLQGLTDEHNQIPVVHRNQAHNKTKELNCMQRECDEFTVLHLGFMDFTHYIISVRFFELEETEHKYPFQDVLFYFHSYNPVFTQVEIWFRFVFLVFTFFVTCWFAHTLRKFAMRNWSIEQKWMSFLLPLLLLYDDPVFPLTFLINSWIPGTLDAMFQATFLCTLLLFWLCTYHGIRQNERRLLTFYIPKLLIVGMLWISAITLSSWQEYNDLRDPTYNNDLDTGNYNGFKVFFFTMSGVYLAYLAYLIIRAYSELRSMQHFDVRLKFLTALMVIVLSISVAITVLRFGVKVLQDNLMAEIATSYNSCTEFMSFYGLLNFYLYTMAYVYSPSKNAVFESHFKDNPALSMINDSDEEVIYGSDAEDKPLNYERDKEESD